MTLDALRGQLQNQIAGGDHNVRVLAALTAASMPAPSDVAALITTQLAISGDLALAGAALEPGGASSIDLSGKAAVLGLDGIELRVTFTASSNAYPDIRVVVTLPAGWSFGASFSALKGTPVDKLKLLKPSFVLTTAAGGDYPWTDDAGALHRAALTRGLNFIADLVPDAVLKLLDAVVTGGTQDLHLPLAGSIETPPAASPWLSPTVAVQAPLARAVKSPPSGLGFTLGTPAVAIVKQRGVTDGPGSVPRVFLRVPLLANDKQILTIDAPVSVQGPYLSFRVGAYGGLSLEEIASLVAGKSIVAQLPDFLKEAFETVGFKSFQLDLVASSMRPYRLGVTVGSVKPWSIPGVATINDTTLAFVVLDPLGQKQVIRTFAADITLFPELKIFPGTFDLAIEDTDDGGVLVSAEYHGSVSLNELLSKMNPALKIPSDLLAVSFEDFGVGFTRKQGAWDWVIHGMSDARFTLPLVSGKVDASLMAKVASTAGKRSYQLIGSLNIGKAFFALEIDVLPTTSRLAATWEMSAGASLGFADLAAAVHLPPPSIPEGLDLALKKATLQYEINDEAKDKSLLLTATSANYGTAIFVALSGTTPSLFAFGVSINLGVTLGDIPLVGSKIPAAQDFGIDTATIWILSRAAKKAEVEKVNTQAVTAAFPSLPDRDIDAPVILSGSLKLGSADPVPLEVALGGSSRSAERTRSDAVIDARAGAEAQGALGAAAPATDDMVWMDVQRQLGIFQFNRIGVGYGESKLRFALDAAIIAGPLSLSLDGLSIASPLTKFQPSFDLSGLGLSYKSGPLEITGALLRVPSQKLAKDVKFQFDGMLALKAGSYSLAAIGSYAQQTSDDPSLFVFAQLEAALGGPPVFFVTGLMAGFGFNRTLEIPGQDEVLDFPLLLLAEPPKGSDQPVKQDPLHVLDVLEGRAAVNGKTKAWIAPQPGEYWLAAGVLFDSFKLVHSKILLVVEFGNNFEIALLGLSTMQLPQPEESSQTYAFVEMQLRVLLQPDSGFLAATAILTKSSYVLTPDCHLTGGFAFYMWFGGHKRAGEFVITLGGYHPAFKPPSYYPTIPRLGFNWALSNVLSIKGSSYFALTPSCIMAGGGLEILFHEGDLQAWFTAQADFLVSWRPFFYSATIDVSIGVSYRLNLLVCHKTISISIGANLELWGPPTGGRVHVHIVVVSFTVGFGSDSAGKNETPLAWKDFKGLLPDPGSVCRITASSGMYKSRDDSKNSSGQLWVVRSKDFGFFTQSAVPASQLAYGKAEQAAGAFANAQGSINIRPMNKAAVKSTHQLVIRRGNSPEPVDVSAWSLQPRTQNVPDSLWGDPPQKFTQTPQLPTAKVIPDQLVGYTVQAPPPKVGATQGPIQLKVLAQELLDPGAAPLSPGVTASPDYVPAFNREIVGRISGIMQTPTKANRDALFAALQKSGLYGGDNGSLAQMGLQAGHLYVDSPMLQA